jgi:hypothetical protein
MPENQLPHKYSICTRRGPTSSSLVPSLRRRQEQHSPHTTTWEVLHWTSLANWRCQWAYSFLRGCLWHSRLCCPMRGLWPARKDIQTSIGFLLDYASVMRDTHHKCSVGVPSRRSIDRANHALRTVPNLSTEEPERGSRVDLDRERYKQLSSVSADDPGGTRLLGNVLEFAATGLLQRWNGN